MTYTQLQNKDGKFVKPAIETFAGRRRRAPTGRTRRASA